MNKMSNEQFTRKIVNDGIKITEFDGKFNHLGFYAFNGKTYQVDFDQNRCSNQSPESFKQMTDDLRYMDTGEY